MSVDVASKTPARPEPIVEQPPQKTVDEIIARIRTDSMEEPHVYLREIDVPEGGE